MSNVGKAIGMMLSAFLLWCKLYVKNWLHLDNRTLAQKTWDEAIKVSEVLHPEEGKFKQLEKAGELAQQVYLQQRIQQEKEVEQLSNLTFGCIVMALVFILLMAFLWWAFNTPPHGVLR